MHVTDDCVACGCCIAGIDTKEAVCPRGAITVGATKAEIDPIVCTNCGKCIKFCGVGAIER